MRATEDKGVDPIRKQGPEVACDHLVGHVIVEQSFFDQRDEQWTCTTTYAHIVISCPKCLFVRPAANRHPGSDHADVAVVGGMRIRRPCPRPSTVFRSPK